ncbi:hypothetical protein LCGC14_1770030 [marine sediment metagenome]|uniref:Uncharacterized protein n=1 Tax=marine sediment metagenome TaxID=412755 RepID=A0A0F9JYA0_9ZZZZ
MKHLEVYSAGIFHVSICTTITDRDEILKELNEQHPSGTDNGWTFSKDKTFHQGGPNPGPCEEGMKGAKHYLMNA